MFVPMELEAKQWVYHNISCIWVLHSDNQRILIQGWWYFIVLENNYVYVYNVYMFHLWHKTLLKHTGLGAQPTVSGLKIWVIYFLFCITLHQTLTTLTSAFTPFIMQLLLKQFECCRHSCCPTALLLHSQPSQMTVCTVPDTVNSPSSLIFHESHTVHIQR